MDNQQKLVQFPATLGGFIILAVASVKNYKTNLQQCHFVAKSSTQRERVGKTFQLPRNGNFRTRSETEADSSLA